MMSVLVCGSLAFDRIMVYDGSFKDAILPEQIHMLSVSFLISSLRQGYGGCAGNVAYNLNLLGIHALPMGTAGHDFTNYQAWFNQHGIDSRYIKIIDDEYTASAFILTDKDDNQITAFHPGAMNHCHCIDVQPDNGIQYALVLPEARAGMHKHARQLSEASIPFLFDPGQGTSMLDKEELSFYIEHADCLACNDYEFRIIQDRTSLDIKTLCKNLRAVIVTRGGEGATIYTSKKTYQIPAIKAKQVCDPTGCGDSHRAALVYGFLNDLDWETTGRLASLIGSLKVAHQGPQNHSFNLNDCKAQFQEHFGYML